jgi:Zn-dependent protease with chaperone function
MSGWLAAIALIALAWGLLAASASAALSLSWPALARGLRRLPPAARARTAFGLALAPTLVPGILVALCLVPGAMTLVGGAGDHCLAHAGHPHLCLAHRGFALSAPLAAVLAISAGAGLFALVRSGRAAVRARRLRAALRRASAGELGAGAMLVRFAVPFSLAVGLWRPRIWISTALADALSREQLDVVLAHEREHVRARDALVRGVARLCAAPLWPRVRRALLGELALASEQACDEAAAVRAGDRLRVAETILAVERLAGATRAFEPIGVLAFGGSTVPERVRSLLAAAPDRTSLRPLAAFAAVIGLGFAFGADGLHHAIEHVIDALLQAL